MVMVKVALLTLITFKSWAYYAVFSLLQSCMQFQHTLQLTL